MSVESDITQLIDKVTRLENEVRELRISIAGDKFNNKVGILDLVGMQHREIWGDESTKHIGLKQRSETDHGRIRSLEHDRLKLYAWVSGISLGSGATAAGIVKWFFN